MIVDDRLMHGEAVVEVTLLCANIIVERFADAKGVIIDDWLARIKVVTEEIRLVDAQNARLVDGLTDAKVNVQGSGLANAETHVRIERLVVVDSM